MSFSLKAKTVATARAAPSRARVVRVSCQKQGDVASVVKAQLAAATLAAATLLCGSPAEAGVVLQQPELKKVFQADATPAPVKAATPKAPSPVAEEKKAETPAAKKEKAEEEYSAGGDLDPRAVALPGAIVGVAGLAFAASKLDGGFDEFMTEAMVKDSNNYAGYEPLLKEGNVAALGRPGTKKVKATTKPGTKKSK